MIRPTRTWRAAAAGAAALLVLSACGGDTEPEAEPGGENTDAAETPTETSSPAAECETKEFSGSGDGTLTIGTLLPQTGSLAFLGPPEFAAVELAVREMNAAGGVLGKDVKKFDSDSGDAQNPIASQSVDRLFSNKVDAIVGAASSSVSLLVIDKITTEGVMEISPANTSDAFSTYCDNGLYFRTAPPDTLQGRVLADTIIADGNQTVGILALQDAYGTGLANHVEKNVTASNGEVVEKIVYDPKAANYATEVSEIKAADPDAVVLIGFAETQKIIPEMIKQGIGPDTKKIYMVDGNLSDYSEEFDPATLGPNVKGTLPGVAATEELKNKLLEVNPKLLDYSYAAESYDATVLTGLAAIAADSDYAPDFSKEMINVSKDGTKCTSFEECKGLLEDGEDIDYDGYSGPVEFLENGDPGVAFIGIYQYKPDNTYEFVEARRGEISTKDIEDAAAAAQ
jgi:ABC-type branched-subunit amino acid transport system substrate-binding protein